MCLAFELATGKDVVALAQLHAAVAKRLTRDFGTGVWSSAPSERSILADLRRPKFDRIIVAHDSRRRIVGTLRLATRKPWAIDVSYFTPIKRPIYLTSMAVHPSLQRRGIGRCLLMEAERHVRDWPGDAIRLDAFDAEAGAGEFYAKCGYREVARVKYKGNPLVYFEWIVGGPSIRN